VSFAATEQPPGLATANSELMDGTAVSKEAGTPKGEAYCGACPAASCVCTEASFVNRSMLACPVPRLASPGAVQVDISVYRGADYSTPGNGAAIMLYVVPEPTSLFATI